MRNTASDRHSGGVINTYGIEVVIDERLITFN